jgi:RimJ/RimL family protein N-acetyltransferase
MKDTLHGQKVILRPMKKDEVQLFYRWATASDATHFWYGERYGAKIPTIQEFLQDWKPHYFDDSNPELGRCFVIILDNTPIGQINYNYIEPENRRTEIDIMIADSKNWGSGYGPDAIMILVSYLFEKMDVLEVWVAAAKDNERAIKSYQKAGFEVRKPPENIKDNIYFKDKNPANYVFFGKIRK